MGHFRYLPLKFTTVLRVFIVNHSDYILPTNMPRITSSTKQGSVKIGRIKNDLGQMRIKLMGHGSRSLKTRYVRLKCIIANLKI